MSESVNNLFLRLSKSKFRSRFKLSVKDVEYIKEKGVDTIERHARDFVTSRLAPAEPKNDGKQTPMKGHPVFIAQHATATCCRGCLSKWYKIPQHKQLDKDEIDYIVAVLMKWIEVRLSSIFNF